MNVNTPYHPGAWPVGAAQDGIVGGQVQQRAMGRQIDDGNVVRVFLMTPYAEAQERAVFHDVIEEVNDMKARAHGVQFKPVGPSESMLGRLRSQALGDKGLLSARLVVAVLWKHWDPDEGARFEALYDLARDNDKEVWLYVHTLNDALLARPDASLRHVLAFRDRVEQEGRVRYIRYDGVADWQAKLLQHLFDWLDNMPCARAFMSLTSSITSDETQIR